LKWALIPGLSAGIPRFLRPEWVAGLAAGAAGRRGQNGVVKVDLTPGQAAHLELLRAESEPLAALNLRILQLGGVMLPPRTSRHRPGPLVPFSGASLEPLADAREGASSSPPPETARTDGVEELDALSVQSVLSPDGKTPQVSLGRRERAHSRAHVREGMAPHRPKMRRYAGLLEGALRARKSDRPPSHHARRSPRGAGPSSCTRGQRFRVFQWKWPSDPSG